MNKSDFKTFLNNFIKPEERISSGFLLISRYRGAVMGLSALWVFFFHIMETVITADHPAAAWTEARIKRFGYCGVDIFFLLSGLGLTYAISKSKLPVFYYRRIKRILLPFVAVALLKAKSDGWSVKWFFEVISGKAFYTVSIYMFLWFVPAILTLYLVFPLYWLGFRKTGAWFWTSTMLLVWFITMLVLRDRIRGDMFGFLNRIPVFMLGVLLGYLTREKRDMVFRRRVWLPVTLVFVLGLYLLEISNFNGYYILLPSSNCFLPTLLTAVSLPFLLAKLLNEMESRRVLCVPGKILNGFLKFYGLFSMELYCIQEWLFGRQKEWLYSFEYTALQNNLILLAEMTAAAYISSIVFGYFWKLAELPFVKLLRKSEKN